MQPSGVLERKRFMDMKPKHPQELTSQASLVASQPQIPATRKPRRRGPHSLLPTQMLVAIDGWPELDRVGAGARVAAMLDGFLVDSSRFYRALAEAGAKAHIDHRDAAAVAK